MCDPHVCRKKQADDRGGGHAAQSGDKHRARLRKNSRGRFSKSRNPNRARDPYLPKSQPRTGHTREPDPTHLKLRHRTTRRTATHERTHTKQTSLTQSHTHTSRSENDVRRRHRPPHTHTHTQPRARGTIACAISTDHSASASARRAPSRCTCRSCPTCVELEAGETRVLATATGGTGGVPSPVPR